MEALTSGSQPSVLSITHNSVETIPLSEKRCHFIVRHKSDLIILFMFENSKFMSHSKTSEKEIITAKWSTVEAEMLEIGSGWGDLVFVLY